MKKIFITLATIISLNGCSNQNADEPEKENKKVIVTTSQAVERTYHPWLEYSGTCYAFKEANLGTTLPGKVEKIHYPEGTSVSQGALLVELSAELYAQALAERNTLEKDLERLTRLKEKGSVPQQKYDHVKAKYEAAKARAEMMRKNSEVRAPFSGTIVDYLVQEGENFMFSPSLKPGYSHTSGIVQLMQLHKLKVEIDVNEQDLPNIKKGQIAEVSFDAFPEKTWKGTVSYIAPILSTQTHTAKVEITIDNSDKILKPGMYSKVRIKMPEKTHVFVPLNSIYRQPGTGNHYVFVLDDKKVNKKSIEKLYNLKEDVAVSGVNGGQQVVVHGKNKLKDGDQVVVKNNASQK